MNTGWQSICALEDLPPDSGCAALIDARQVAIFRVGNGVHALDNFDPNSGANVLSRGIVGSKGDVVTVASPVFKQRFDLRTGRCLDDELVSVPTYDVRVVDGWIEIEIAS